MLESVGLVIFIILVFVNWVCVYYLWKYREREYLVGLFLLHILLSFTPIGLVSWMFVFLAPRRKDIKLEPSSFDEKFGDENW